MPHQSEYAFMDAQMPVLNPAGVQDVLDLGILGWELSRYSGPGAYNDCLWEQYRRLEGR